MNEETDLRGVVLDAVETAALVAVADTEGKALDEVPLESKFCLLQNINLILKTSFTTPLCVCVCVCVCVCLFLGREI